TFDSPAKLCFSRRLCPLRFRRYLGSRGLFFVFLDQTANRVGGLGAFTDPIFGAIELDRAVMTGLFWIVRADDLDKLSVARAAAIGNDHFVLGAIQRSFSA